MDRIAGALASKAERVMAVPALGGAVPGGAVRMKVEGVHACIIFTAGKGIIRVARPPTSSRGGGGGGGAALRGVLPSDVQVKSLFGAGEAAVSRLAVVRVVCAIADGITGWSPCPVGTTALTPVEFLAPASCRSDYSPRATFARAAATVFSDTLAGCDGLQARDFVCTVSAAVGAGHGDTPPGPSARVLVSYVRSRVEQLGRTHGRVQRAGWRIPLLCTRSLDRGCAVVGARGASLPAVLKEAAARASFVDPSLCFDPIAGAGAGGGGIAGHVIDRDHYGAVELPLMLCRVLGAAVHGDVGILSRVPEARLHVLHRSRVSGDESPGTRSGAGGGSAGWDLLGLLPYLEGGMIDRALYNADALDRIDGDAMRPRIDPSWEGGTRGFPWCASRRLL
jgi:hypothetical protein